MQGKYNFVIILAISALFVTGVAWAHSVLHEIEENRAVIIKVCFENNEPMSHAHVNIFAPGNQDKLFQSGYTDKNGCFAFLPNRPGKWNIKVFDKTGHGVMASTLVKEGTRIDPPKPKYSRWQKLVTGISVICALTCLMVYFLPHIKK